jgi:large subunit ribosomal protein L24
MALARIRKGDTVVVTRGRDRGKRGTVLLLIPERDRVVVEGITMIKRHRKPQGNDAGGILEREASLHASNVMPVCGQCGDPTRVGHSRSDDGAGVRVCRRCGQSFEA